MWDWLMGGGTGWRREEPAGGGGGRTGWRREEPAGGEVGGRRLVEWKRWRWRRGVQARAADRCRLGWRPGWHGVLASRSGSPGPAVVNHSDHSGQLLLEVRVTNKYFVISLFDVQVLLGCDGSFGPI